MAPVSACLRRVVRPSIRNRQSAIRNRLCAGLLLALLLPAVSAPAQEIRYLYDALNRLVGVVDQQGNAAEYVYDAVGNLLQIKRFDVDPNAAVSITLVSPSKGSVGTPVQIFGKGFSPTPSQNTVTFGGGTAPVTAATATRLTTTVPAGATTGPLTVTVGTFTATSPEPFTVLQSLAVVPDQADVALGGTVDFQATLGGTPLLGGVTWRVNGSVGGNATLGTITTAGLYTAPSTPPPVQPLAIEAVLTADPTQIATATVRVVGQVAGLTAAPPVTVASATTQFAQPLSGPVSVGVTPATGAPTLSGPLSVTGGPVITIVSPTTGALGNTGLSATLTGTNLHGASGLRFLRNGTSDSTLTASAILPGGDGTSVSFSLTISGTASTGARVVQVVTPQGTSTNFDLGTNLFTVTP